MGRVDQLREFIKQSPRDPFPRYGLALELKNEGRLEESSEAFAELLREFPDYTPGYLHAGGVLRALGRTADAIRVFRDGIVAATRKSDSHAKGELEAALAELTQ
jgi:hypothetical protein